MWLAAGSLLGLGLVLGFAPLYVNASSHWSLMRPGLGYGCGSVFHAQHEPIGPHTDSLVVGFDPCSPTRSYFQVLTWLLIALGFGTAVAAIAMRAKREHSIGDVGRNVAT